MLCSGCQLCSMAGGHCTAKELQENVELSGPCRKHRRQTGAVCRDHSEHKGLGVAQSQAGRPPPPAEQQGRLLSEALGGKGVLGPDFPRFFSKTRQQPRDRESLILLKSRSSKIMKLKLIKQPPQGLVNT